MPSWQRVSSDTLESAAEDSLPLLIYFPDENDSDFAFADKELAAMSKDEAVFVKVPYTDDREASPWAKESVVPTSKILGDNPSRDYDVPVGKFTVIVADSYGNEYFRLTRKPSADQLRGYFEKVKDQVDKADKKLQKNLEKANDCLAKEDRKNAVKYLLKNFKEGVVGLKAQEDTIRVYHDILDTARGEMAKLVEKGDTDGLKSLAKELKDTDMESEIDEALDDIK